MREVEEYLVALEKIKYQIITEIYAMADELHDQCKDLENGIEDDINRPATSAVERLTSQTKKLLVSSECQGF